MKFKLSNEGEMTQHSRSGIILNGYRHLTILEVMNLLNEQDREITESKIDCNNLMIKQNKIVKVLQERYNKAREANNKSIEGSFPDIVSYAEMTILKQFSEKIGVKLDD